MIINDPAVIAELTELYFVYERALVSNDADTLISMFWTSPFVARLGATENLYGFDDIAAFRKNRAAGNLARTVEGFRIVSFGNDFASITLEFQRMVAGRITHGRQSQTWVRLAEGWRIVSAHVSLLPESSDSQAQLSR